jgi:outer membrane protein OmpA-like peptidoglycan-associated protein
LRVTIWASASIVLLTIVASEPVAAQNASGGRSSSVDVDLGVLDSLGPPAAPEGKRPSSPKPPPARRGETPPSGGQAPLPKPAAVPPPPKLPPPAAPAAKSTAQPEPPVAATATTAPGTDIRAVPPPPATTPSPTTAALPPPAAPAAAAAAVSAGRIAFASGDSALSDDAKAQLAPLLAKLSSNERLHVDLLGYAAGGKDQSQARRLSLARALAVRSYLVDRGIPSTRVDVRALGSRGETASTAGPAGNGPADRVDAVLSERPMP